MKDRTNELREASGRITFNDPLTSFIYQLLRDEMPAGKVEALVRSIVNEGQQEVLFTNGWLAQYANNLADMIKNAQSIKLGEALTKVFEDEENSYIAKQKEIAKSFESAPLTRKSVFYRWRQEDREKEGEKVDPTKAVAVEEAKPRCMPDTCSASSFFGIRFGSPRCVAEDELTYDCGGKQPPRLTAASQLISAAVYADVLKSVIDANNAVNDRYRSWTMYGYGSMGELKARTLESGDVAGLRKIYPGDTKPSP